MKKQFLHFSPLHLFILIINFIFYASLPILNAQSITVDVEETYQTIESIGASDAWDLGRIGKYWPSQPREEIAELLFSVETDDMGQPRGIGLSQWRVNIGAGSAEQGSSSEIEDKVRRAESYLLSPDAPILYVIKNKESAKVLSVLDDSGTWGKEIVQTTEGTTASQYWEITYQGNEEYRIVNAHTGLCLEIGGSTSTPYDEANQWNCGGSGSAEWNLESDIQNYFLLKNVNSGLVLSPDTSSTNDPSIIQLEITNEDAQKWEIVPENYDHFTYDWSKQIGHQYFAQKAKDYGVQYFTAFSNSPHTSQTKNGLATRINGESATYSNIQAHKYHEFSKFLVDVLEYYETQGIDFDYISPINEPQYPWNNGKQEGCHWINEEIAIMMTQLNEELENRNSDTQMLLGEAGSYKALYTTSTNYTRVNDQIDEFFDPSSQYFIGDLSHLPPAIAAHSYWTTGSTSTIRSVRTSAYNKSEEYGIDLHQSEYSLLGSGHPDSYILQALYLAKIIHADFTIANVKSWSYWTAAARERWGHKNRFHLIELRPEGGPYQDIDIYGYYEAERSLWALGNFSRFIRPNYTRVGCTGADDYDGLMASSYISPDQTKLILVLVNNSDEQREVDITLDNLAPGTTVVEATPYTTSEVLNLYKGAALDLDSAIHILPESIVTLEVELGPECTTIPDMICESRIDGGSWQTEEDCALSICEGTTLQLSVNPNVSNVNWTGPNGFTSNQTNNINFNNLTDTEAGEYTATLTQNGCTDTRTITLNVEALPQATVSITDGDCTTQTGTLTFQFPNTANRTNIAFSIDGGITYPYNYADNTGSQTVSGIAVGSYNIWSRWGNDKCPVDLGNYTINSPTTTQQGQACDDADECTVNDIYDANCNCVGTLLDTNNDNICDLLCTDIQLNLWLEGAYDPALGEMTTQLNTRGLLPGQTPLSNLVPPTPAGQPYSASPWNYAGTEGAGWTDANYTGDETDWVLVSFRTGIEKNTEVGMTTGLLMKGGSINFPDRCALTSTVASPLYIVVEHRNHIGIMTENPVSIVGNILSYDFRLANSFNNSTGFGQKQLPTGEWVMYAGDSDQSDFPSYDITGSDKNIWTQNNGLFDYYLSPDFNLDGDVNGADKNIWERNNGISSRVPK